MPAMSICSREVRVIPKGWEHPKDDRGRYIGLMSANYYPSTPEKLKEWMEEFETNTPPNRDEYMPYVEGLIPEETELMAYETTSEGTPISPAFPNTTEGKIALVRYCAENCTTFIDYKTSEEAWAAILFSESTALIGMDGSVSMNLPGPK